MLVAAPSQEALPVSNPRMPARMDDPHTARSVRFERAEEYAPVAEPVFAFPKS